MTPERITRADIDALLAYLPVFERPGWEPVRQWRGGADEFPYPQYAPEVDEFFTLTAQPRWSDYHYDPQSAEAVLEDDAAVRAAGLGQVRTLLTYCTRGERFSDGFWGEMVRTGRVAALLRRLQELRDTVPDRASG